MSYWGGRVPQPPEPPAELPDGIDHGTRKAHRKFKCRCLPCQEWARDEDRRWPRQGRYKPDRPWPTTGWYVCASRWGGRFAEHEYNRKGACIVCGADRTTEEYWERKWQS